MSSFSAAVVENTLVYCLRDVLLHGYVRVCVCSNMCGRATYSMCVRTFNAILAHPGIVNSLLSKLLNGVTTRAGALFFFCIYFIFRSLILSPRGQRTTGGRIGNKYIYFSFWRSSLMRGTCEAQASDFGKDYLCPSTPHLCHTGLVKPLCDW